MEYKYLPYSRDFSWEDCLNNPNREEDIMKTCEILYKINTDSLPDQRSVSVYRGLSYYNFRRLSEISEMASKAEEENREEDFEFLKNLYQKVYLYFDNSRGKYRPAFTQKYPGHKKTKSVKIHKDIKYVQLQKK